MLDGDRRPPDDAGLPVCLTATIEAAGAALPLAGRTVTLSRGGLSLQFVGLLDPGAPVRITLHCRPALRCVGRIAWTDRAFVAGQASAGIAFAAVLPGDRVITIASEAVPSAERMPGTAADA